MELRSQNVRTLAPENDPLKMGMGWKVEDLSKPQILVESTFGDSHPGSAHLDQFVKEAVQAVNDNDGKAARYFATDMCDGIAQGHDGINYSLPHQTRKIRTYFRLEKGSDFSFSSGTTTKVPVDGAKPRYLVIDRKTITRFGGYDYEVR